MTTTNKNTDRVLSALAIGLTIHFKQKPAEGGWESVFVDEKYFRHWYPRLNLKYLSLSLSNDNETVFTKGHQCLVSECLHPKLVHSRIVRAQEILEIENIKHFIYYQNAPLGAHIIIRLV